MERCANVWRAGSYLFAAAAILAAGLALLAPAAAPLSLGLGHIWPSGSALPAADGRPGLVLLALLLPLATESLLRFLRPPVRRTAILVCSVLGGVLIGVVEPALLMALALAMATATTTAASPDAATGPRQPSDLPLVAHSAEVQGDGALTFDRTGTILAADATAREMLGGDPLGRSLYRYLPRLARSCPTVDSLIGHRFETELQHESTRFHRVEAVFWAADAPGAWSGQARLTSVAARAERLAELERLALHDALTGLPNRTLFGDRARQAIAVAERQGESFAVMLLDLDRFKQINDTLGHATGDRLLQAIGPRLVRALRKSDTLARLGGDEFAVLLPPAVDFDKATASAERLTESLVDPITIDGMSLELGVSVGVALYPEHGTDLDTLMRNADVAMYKAKREQSGFSVFDTVQAIGSARRLTLQRDLRVAIERGDLRVLFQPRVAANGWTNLGLEALVRWQHPIEGLLEPTDFLPIAEHTGLVMPLTLSVLNQCLEAQRSWRHLGIELPVSINVSAKWLKDPAFPRILGLLLRNAQGRADQLMLEIPESAVMLDPEGTIRTLENVAKLGVGIALDSFGTGYSSLPLLQRLPIKALKIDRTFVGELFEQQSASVIIRSIVRMAHGLGLKVIAEGVESGRAANRLAGIGCDELQGLFVGRPMAGESVPEWLAEQAEQRATRV
ncbi:MAG: EAL domain-containing protein [Geminicoccaceae bacterium]|jgi:diguanylate cyclase (GGDEF)-like protein|nr:EAL domain-containing protein [Geminicoccaceae bacterium]